ncbi:argininosuccinate lyase [Haliangium ochraceum]|uniref:Argininosuccinate lyase n=1 Tax=Haliangium ochraceum (strain DSM 14365 / JCM 11303 / SMP-2) TaxID=502025 RepID=D0LZL6_HALO1|nr:argininosuccinate lyase [Haliangium ochraceum]ACY17995.1 argininosuccinate lyase [Haliangium ochraceum DSM 14365]
MTDAKGARGRRFAGSLAPDATEVNASVGFDWRLLPHDVAGSLAHARMLAKQGIISADDLARIEAGIQRAAERLQSGEVPWDPALEDVHMNVEARLIEEVGEPGRRLHTARSRNDQVATDLRLYARAQAAVLIERIDELRRALADKAACYLDVFMPGYTHLQRAQPVRLAHHLLAYDAMLRRDRGRIEDASARAGECPLGAGALAATTFPIDREATARELGFTGVTRNSLDAVGDRDFAVELVAAIALCQVHLSRLGEEIVLWLSQEFGFARLDESYCSGSSIMPQKMNPDLAELIRGKTGRVVGHWVSLVTVLKGLPLAYNKDLQESQEPLFDAVETLDASLRVARGMIDNLVFDEQRLARAVTQGFLLATEVADYLVTKGMSFREGHHIAGALVRTALERQVGLEALPLEVFRGESELFEDDIFSWLEVGRAVDRRDVVGGPARSQIEAELVRIRAELETR